MICVEELGKSVLMISVAADWFGSKGGSWTDSKTKGEDESKKVPVWIACTSLISAQSLLLIGLFSFLINIIAAYSMALLTYTKVDER